MLEFVLRINKKGHQSCLGSPLMSKTPLITYGSEKTSDAGFATLGLSPLESLESQFTVGSASARASCSGNELQHYQWDCHGLCVFSKHGRDYFDACTCDQHHRQRR